MKEVIEFLKEYEQLCQKYKLGLTGCGCCGSPSLYYKENKKLECIDHINYDERTNNITINNKLINDFIKEMEENNE